MVADNVNQALHQGFILAVIGGLSLGINFGYSMRSDYLLGIGTLCAFLGVYLLLYACLEHCVDCCWHTRPSAQHV